MTRLLKGWIMADTRPIDSRGGFIEAGDLAPCSAGRFQDTYDRAWPLLQERLSPKRFAHVVSVSSTARDMALVYDADPDAAAIAGLLHDWDKCYDDQGIFARAQELGIQLTEEEQAMGSIVHARTGAVVTQRLFPKLPDEVFSAIAKHTVGDLEMSDLDIILYTADLLEPTRKLAKFDKLRGMIGRVGLQDLFLLCYEGTMTRLVERHRLISQSTLDLWNHLVRGEEERARTLGMTQWEYRDMIEGKRED